MMKRVRILFCMIFFWSIVANAGKIAVGSDLVGEMVESGTAEKITDPHIRAMEYYISGLLEKDPSKRTECFYRAVSLDPGRKLPVFLLVKSLEKSPHDAGRVYQLLLKISGRFPRDIFFARQLSTVGLQTDIPFEEQLEKMLPAIHKKPAQEERKYYRQLAENYVDCLLRTSRKTEILPFEADETALQEIALLYYGIRLKRDRLAMVESVAAAEFEKYKTKIAAAEFTDLAGLRIHIGLLNSLKLYALAENAAAKWFKAKRDSWGALLLLDVFIRSGKTGELEKMLKNIPSLTPEYCADARIRCFLKAGNPRRALEETANIADPFKREIKRFLVAAKMRDAALMRKSLAELEKLPDSSDQIALELLMLAAISRDPQVLYRAKKILQGKYEKNPDLANSVGYVSAVLGVDLPEAEKLLTFAVSASPRDAAYLDSMAWVKFKRGDLQGAKEYILRAIQCIDRRIGEAVMADHAGDIFLALNERGRALKYYQLALKCYQEFPEDNTDFSVSGVKQKIAELCSGKKR